MERTQEHASRSDSFDRFLYADVGTQANGMPVTMLSVLARRGLEPWTEAKRLAGLPRWKAVDELAHVLVRENSVWSPTSRETVSRLVLLLPEAGRSGGNPDTPSSSDREMPKLLLICAAIGMLYAFGMAVVNASLPKAETASSRTTVADNWSKVLRMREGSAEGSTRSSATY